jgi:hypothetical protein
MIVITFRVEGRDHSPSWSDRSSVLLGDDSLGWPSRSSGGGSPALVVLLVVELFGVGHFRRIRRDVRVDASLLPRTVTILVESSTAFLGSIGDDGGDLGRWL